MSLLINLTSHSYFTFSSCLQLFIETLPPPQKNFFFVECPFLKSIYFGFRFSLPFSFIGPLLLKSILSGFRIASPLFVYSTPPLHLFYLPLSIFSPSLAIFWPFPLAVAPLPLLTFTGCTIVYLMSPPLFPSHVYSLCSSFHLFCTSFRSCVKSYLCFNQQFFGSLLCKCFIAN